MCGGGIFISYQFTRNVDKKKNLSKQKGSITKHYNEYTILCN